MDAGKTKTENGHWEPGFRKPFPETRTRNPANSNQVPATRIGNMGTRYKDREPRKQSKGISGKNPKTGQWNMGTRNQKKANGQKKPETAEKLPENGDQYQGHGNRERKCWEMVAGHKKLETRRPQQETRNKEKWPASGSRAHSC